MTVGGGDRPVEHSCGLCGFRFTQDDLAALEGRSCGGCAGCGAIRCPNCGALLPGESRIAGAVVRLVRRMMGRKKDSP